MMQDRVYQTPIQDVADLRQCLVDTCSGFSQSIVDDAIDEWRKRLQARVGERGHSEHLSVILGLCCTEKLDNFSFAQQCVILVVKSHYCTVHIFPKVQWQQYVGEVDT